MGEQIEFVISFQDAAMLLFLLLYWVIGTGVNVLVAREKGRDDFVCGVCSIVFTPCAAYLYLLAVPNIPVGERAEDHIPEKEWMLTLTIIFIVVVAILLFAF